jgi:hypothetical protein
MPHRFFVSFADDLASVYIHTHRCGNWGARLVVSPTGDAMALIGLHRVDGGSLRSQRGHVEGNA